MGRSLLIWQRTSRSVRHTKMLLKVAGVPGRAETAFPACRTSNAREEASGKMRKFGYYQWQCSQTKDRQKRLSYPHLVDLSRRLLHPPLFLCPGLSLSYSPGGAWHYFIFFVTISPISSFRVPHSISSTNTTGSSSERLRVCHPQARFLLSLRRRLSWWRWLLWCGRWLRVDQLGLALRAERMPAFDPSHYARATEDVPTFLHL